MNIKFASELKRIPALSSSTSTLARNADIGDSEVVASVFNSSMYDVALIASIFDNSNLAIAKAASIFDDTNLTIAKAASILENTNLTLSRARDVLDNANLSSDREQGHLQRVVDDDEESRLLDIVTLNSTDITFSADTTITDTNVYKDVVVNSGVTLTLNTSSDNESAVLIANSVANSGTITRTAQGTGGGVFYRIGSDESGHGGNSGNSGYHGGGGARDGLPNGASNTYITKTNAAELHAELHYAVVDYLITTLEGKSAPSSPITFHGVHGGIGGNGQWGEGGTGGGGLLIITKTFDNNSTVQANGNDGESALAGGGGGSGGEIIIATGTFDNGGGTLRSNGGKGGNAGWHNSASGGGGGGGMIYVLYKNMVSSGTFEVNGGAKGTGGRTDGTDGSPGVAKTYNIS